VPLTESGRHDESDTNSASRIIAGMRCLPRIPCFISLAKEDVSGRSLRLRVPLDVERMYAAGMVMREEAGFMRRFEHRPNAVYGHCQRVGILLEKRVNIPSVSTRVRAFSSEMATPTSRSR
jgi:hypothetical protein